MERMKRYFNEHKQTFVIGFSMFLVVVLVIVLILIAKRENRNRQVFIEKVKNLYAEIKVQYDESLKDGKPIHFFNNAVNGIRFQKDKLKYCAMVDDNGNFTSIEATDGRYYVKTDDVNKSNRVRRSSYKKFECSKQLPMLAKSGYNRKDGRRENVFGGTLEEHRIEKIVFMPTTTVPEKAIDSFDASAKKDKSVIAWYTDEDKNSMYELYIGGDGGVAANTDASYMFGGIYNLVEIDSTYLDTSKTTTMEGMFYYLTNLKKLDLSNLDTSRVTNMSRMFYYVVGVADLDLKTFDTSNVEDMSEMFLGCWSITALNVKSFDTSSVKDMHSMFESCSKLIDVDLNNFDTRKVKNAQSMFKACYLLNDDNLKNFNIPDIDNIDHMFCDTQFNKESKVSKTYTGKKIDNLFKCE